MKISHKITRYDTVFLWTTSLSGDRPIRQDIYLTMQFLSQKEKFSVLHIMFS